MESVSRGTAALLFCALLCWQQEGTASLRARCVQGHCYFQTLENFEDAKKECENQMGGLLVPKCKQTAVMTNLLSGVNGRFWLRNIDGEEPSRCSAVSARKGQNATCVSEPCQDRLDGFLCQFEPGDTCGVLQTDAQVIYNTSRGFTVEDSFPDSKHLCISNQWIPMNGVYQCVCREGFRLSPKDPTRCEEHCNSRDCKAECLPNIELEAKDMQQCYCPKGYITDNRNGTVICTDINECEQQKVCDHHCENLYGSYRCSCDDGFYLQDHGSCVPLDLEVGSGSDFPHLAPSNTPASLQPASVPSYIKAGSILGISLFMVLCVVLLGCLVRNMMRQCRAFNISSFKHPDIDLFYLQQVTAETYKRLSLDKQPRNDSQRLETTN
uniref:Thrombomodulin n=1 Tax=Oryzias latipes TaxID=8090 RepID=A0A3P9K745_ORYLA